MSRTPITYPRIAAGPSGCHEPDCPGCEDSKGRVEVFHRGRAPMIDQPSSMEECLLCSGRGKLAIEECYACDAQHSALVLVETDDNDPEYVFRAYCPECLALEEPSLIKD